ncbi:MAG: hypothetical protein JO154_06745 [Chitinophaga sp.]|uniref:hypothetical protein n=1 Tax=Chitinophaga sp. TaxID=1869181 RepID=UPI0025C3FF6F|nr:hypothetical protein [Chitinophaga sp.]MBV8252290.1 hypothetical protein [Chitinophaga sp.]
MSIHFILCTLGTITIIAFIIVLIIQTIKRKLSQTISEIKNDRQLFSNSEIGKALHAYIKAISNDDSNRSNLLENLNKNPAGCLKELTVAFENLTESEYNSKWLLVYCISQFESGEFTKLLSKIALAEIPYEKSTNIDLYSTVREETAIRLRAIEGLRPIAQKGIKEAEEVLFDLLKSKYLTLNISACQSLMRIDPDNENKILKLLPHSKHDIITIRHREVKEVAVIENPEQFITNAGPIKMRLPKPGMDDNYSSHIQYPGKNSPKINH